MIFIIVTCLFLAAESRSASAASRGTGLRGNHKCEICLESYLNWLVDSSTDDDGCFGNHTTYFGNPLMQEVDMVFHGSGYVDCFKTQSHTICPTKYHGFCLKGHDGVFRPDEVQAGDILCSGEEILEVNRGIYMDLYSPESSHPISTDVTLHEIDTHGICTGQITTWSQASLVDKMFLELKPSLNSTQSIRDLPDFYCLRFMLSLSVSSGENTAEDTEHWHLLSNTTQEESKAEWKKYVWSKPHIKFLAKLGGIALLHLIVLILLCCGMWRCCKRICVTTDTRTNKKEMKDMEMV